jgi:Short C-terminal domain
VRTTERADGPGLGAASVSDPIAQIQRLGELRAQGTITEEEFEAKKKALMARIG